MERIVWARGFWRRGLGLMGRAPLGPGAGLVLAPCRLIHTGLMRFALDLIFFSKDYRVVRLIRAVAPWRLAYGSRQGWGVVEIQAGWLSPERLKPGDTIVFQAAPATIVK